MRPLRDLLILSLILAAAEPALASGTSSKSSKRAPGSQQTQPAPSAGPFGRLATKADLQGTWRLDVEASVANLMAALSMTDAQARKLLSAPPGQTPFFVFAGDQVESRQAASGPVTWKGTFQVDGKDLVFTHDKVTEKLQVGMKGASQLVIGMMGVPTGVYVKQ
jgi:hypothetical protein